MQCNAMQCNAMQCNAMQCNAMQCNAMQRNAMPCNAMQSNAMQCNAMQCNAMQCNAMQCNALNYTAMRCNVMYIGAHMPLLWSLHYTVTGICPPQWSQVSLTSTVLCYKWVVPKRSIWNVMNLTAIECNATQCNDAGSKMIDPHVILAMPFYFIFISSHLYYWNIQFLLWQCHLTWF